MTETINAILIFIASVTCILFIFSAYKVISKPKGNFFKKKVTTGKAVFYSDDFAEIELPSLKQPTVQIHQNQLLELTPETFQ